MKSTALFDPQQALAYAARLAVPRRPGSSAEHQAGEQIAGMLEGWGYQVQRQDFSFVDALPGFIKAEVLIGQALILGIVWAALSGWPSAPLLGVLLAGWIASTGWMNNAAAEGCLEAAPAGRNERWKQLIQPLARRLQSANYVAFHDRAGIGGIDPGLLESNFCRGGNANIAHGVHGRFRTRRRAGSSGQSGRASANWDKQRPVLFLVAHYDSKSQRIPIAARIGLVSMAMGGGLLLSGLVLLSMAYPQAAELIPPVGLFSVVAGIPLLFLGEGDRSPGAIDNASGAGLVLHLAEVYAQSSEMRERFDLCCLFTGAEETGCIGARAFIRQHGRMLGRLADRAPLVILNIDGIGVDGTLRWIGRRRNAGGMGGPTMFERLTRSARDVELPLRGFGLPGALYDHIPFSRAGFEAGTIIATSRASLAVHTARDDVARLRIEGFRKAGTVVLDLMASHPGFLS